MRLARRATPTFVVADEDPFHPPELDAISMRPLPDSDGERGDGGDSRVGVVVAQANDREPSAARDAEAAQASTTAEAADPATEMWASVVADQQAVPTTTRTKGRRWPRAWVAMAAVA